jgi:hypothetical protein
MSPEELAAYRQTRAEVKARARAKRQAQAERRAASAALIAAGPAARKMTTEAMKRLGVNKTQLISAMHAADPTRTRAEHVAGYCACFSRLYIRNPTWWVIAHVLGLDLPPALVIALGAPPTHLRPADPRTMRRRATLPPRPPRYPERLHHARDTAAASMRYLMLARGLTPWETAKKLTADAATRNRLCLALLTLSSDDAPVVSKSWREVARIMGASLSDLCPDPEWLALQPQEEPAQ